MHTRGVLDMENIKKNFGFGCMRLPLKDGEIDLAETCLLYTSDAADE